MEFLFFGLLEGVDIFFVAFQLALEVEVLPALVAHHGLLLAMHLVEVLAQICVLLSTFRTLQLVPLMNQPYVLSEIAVLLSTNGTWSPTLIVDICDVPLKICLQITAVATVTALVFLQLTMLLVYVVLQVGEFSEAMRTFGKFIALLLLPLLFVVLCCIFQFFWIFLSFSWVPTFLLSTVTGSYVVDQIILQFAAVAAICTFEILIWVVLRVYMLR